MQSLQRNFGETKSVLHQLSLLRGQLDKQPANAQRLLIHAFDQTMFAPMITRQAPALDQRLQVERLLQTNATENQFITFAKALTSQPSRYSTAEMMLPAQMRGNRIFLSRLLAERHFHCRALNEVKDKFNLFHQQHWETLSQILIHSRQRAEKQRGGLSPDYREGRRQENLPSINFNAPAGPILRKSAVVRQMAPANMNSPSIPETVLPGPIPPAPPIDLNRLTEQVMQQIDRRLVIWRERSGRV